ncbi:zinc finger protein 8-like [Patiria miniata]|uniref:C2H2-type domain-containing protein n=1 Tax=Patiria miniata TaxID=46514 RepID=A0A914BHM7_PATMI|nr:zinc finger protein 8-like [Patiria miniata]
MEDPNNNEDYASCVPDYLMPDLIATKDELCPDEQSVPVFDRGCPAEDQYNPAAGWMGNQIDFPTYHSQVNGNYMESAPSGQPLQLNYDPAWLAPSFTSEGALSTNHVAEPTHVPQHPAASSSSGLHCSVCFRTFKQKLSLTNHQRSHTARQPHLCTICGETFKYKTNFKRHRRIHAKEMKICRYCGTNMESDYDLVQHEKEHRRQQKQL